MMRALIPDLGLSRPSKESLCPFHRPAIETTIEINYKQIITFISQGNFGKNQPL
jgi:hypothetical protein